MQQDQDSKLRDFHLLASEMAVLISVGGQFGSCAKAGALCDAINKYFDALQMEVWTTVQLCGANWYLELRPSNPAFGRDDAVEFRSKCQDALSALSPKDEGSSGEHPKYLKKIKKALGATAAKEKKQPLSISIPDGGLIAGLPKAEPATAQVSKLETHVTTEGCDSTRQTLWVIADNQPGKKRAVRATISPAGDDASYSAAWELLKLPPLRILAKFISESNTYEVRARDVINAHRDFQNSREGAS